MCTIFFTSFRTYDPKVFFPDLPCEQAEAQAAVITSADQLMCVTLLQ